MTVFKKIKNRTGVSLVELLIVIGLMAVVLTPAYMSLLNGYRIFEDESTYQGVVRDVHMFFERVNTDVRLSGFHEASALDKTQMSGHNELENIDGKSALKVRDRFYTLDGEKLVMLYFSGKGKQTLIRRTLVDHIGNFSVSEDLNTNVLSLEVKLSVDGREQDINTKIYKRFKKDID